MTRKSSTSSDLANRRFAWLLEERCYPYWIESELESKIQLRGKRPDFYFEVPNVGPVLAEVESFREPTSGLSPGFSQFDPEVHMRRIRTAVQHASRQLEPYRELKIPMLVVLDNWRLVGIPSNVGFLRQALFGNLEFRMLLPKNNETQFEGPFAHHGGGQTLHPERKTYISAVAWNMPKQAYLYTEHAEEKSMRLRVVHNLFASVPLPAAIFDDAEDEHYHYDDVGAWRKFWPIPERQAI
jgi:hypothetical protein